MALESMGFTENGKSMTMIKELHQTDNFKINPRGGLIGTGHPLGATGIAQTIEVVQQLQGKLIQDKSRMSKRISTQHVCATTSSTVLVLEK